MTGSGVGIAESHIERLFQPFGQVDSSTTRKFGGTGLGLALSRKLAQAMGGDVTLKNTVIGKGCTFEIAVNVKALEKTLWVDSLIQPEQSAKFKNSFQNDK